MQSTYHKKGMPPEVAKRIYDCVEPQVNKDSGNIILIVGSSECGKSTLTAKVLLPIFSKSNGFITTFMSPNYDSIPIQQAIIDAIENKGKIGGKGGGLGLVNGGIEKNEGYEKESKEQLRLAKKRKKDKAYYDKIASKKGNVFYYDPTEIDQEGNTIAGYMKKIAKKRKRNEKKEEKKDEGAKGGGGGEGKQGGNKEGISGLPQFEIGMLYKTEEWIFTKRGFDPAYCHKIYHARLLLNKRHETSGKVRDFRFAFVLDDEIDIKGSLIREVCMTWRNKNISWIQNVQDLTTLDTAVRNSAPLFFFGYSNFPARRELICRNYLAPFLKGAKIRDKMDTFYQLTSNKCFIFMNHRLRKCFHINTQNGACTELRELTTNADHEGGGEGGDSGNGIVSNKMFADPFPDQTKRSEQKGYSSIPLVLPKATGGGGGGKGGGGKVGGGGVKRKRKTVG